MTLKPGYAYALDFEIDDEMVPASRAVFSCPDEHWSIEVVGDDDVALARHIGTRVIDDAHCNVFSVGEPAMGRAKVYAQTIAHGG